MRDCHIIIPEREVVSISDDYEIGRGFMAEVMIRAAAESDFNFYYSIKCETDNVYWCGHTQKPQRDELFRFFRATIQPHDVLKKRTLFIVEDKLGGEKLGYLYLDPIDDDSAEISVGIMQSFSGRGYGRQAVCELCDLAYKSGFNTIHAMIREDNLRSQNMFLRAGFEKSDVYRFLHIQDRDVKMIEYRKLN